jgi:hypothetical protein
LLDEDGALQFLLPLDQLVVQFLLCLLYLVAKDVHLPGPEAFLSEQAIEAEKLLTQHHILIGKLLALWTGHG